LDELLPGEGALLAGVLNFLAALGSLRRGQATQFTIFGPTKIVFGTQLLARIQPSLRLRLQVGTCLGRGLGLLPQGTLLADLLLLSRTIDHGRRLMTR